MAFFAKDVKEGNDYLNKFVKLPELALNKPDTYILYIRTSTL